MFGLIMLYIKSKFGISKKKVILIFLGLFIMLSVILSPIIFFIIDDNSCNTYVEETEKKDRQSYGKYKYKVILRGEEGFDDGCTDINVDWDGKSVDEAALLQAIKDWMGTVKNDDWAFGFPLSEKQINGFKTIIPGSIMTYYKHKIFPSVTIFQFAIESDWGSGNQSVVQLDKNVFGIKEGSCKHEEGIKVSRGTWATDDGGYYVRYESIEDSISDHGMFLDDRWVEGGGIYTRKGVMDATNAIQQIERIQMPPAYASGDDGTGPHPERYVQSFVNNFYYTYSLAKYDELAVKLIAQVAAMNKPSGGSGSWKPDGSLSWIEKYGVKEKDLTKNAAKVINKGYQYVGSPYVYGGIEEPKKDSNGNWVSGGFDCSSFMQFIIKSMLGIDITRTTYSQVECTQYLTRISSSDIKPGDLAYDFGSGSPEHVGMYIGKGNSPGYITMMHAPQSGELIKVANYPEGNLVYYRVKGLN